MLDAAIKNQLQAYLGKVTHDVEITASLDNSEKSQEIRTMLQEITALSSRLSYRESNEANERKPSFALNRTGSNMGVRFAGIPMVMNSHRWYWRYCKWVAILRRPAMR